MSSYVRVGFYDAVLDFPMAHSVRHASLTLISQATPSQTLDAKELRVRIQSLTSYDPESQGTLIGYEHSSTQKISPLQIHPDLPKFFVGARQVGLYRSL